MTTILEQITQPIVLSDAEMARGPTTNVRLHGELRYRLNLAQNAGVPKARVVAIALERLFASEDCSEVLEEARGYRPRGSKC
ncbi:MAG: hypothetical protein AAF329_14425 [Cyanobacteria bacterium P01_A01_bin.17]